MGLPPPPAFSNSTQIHPSFCSITTDVKVVESKFAMVRAHGFRNHARLIHPPGTALNIYRSFWFRLIVLPSWSVIIGQIGAFHLLNEVLLARWFR